MTQKSNSEKINLRQEEISLGCYMEKCANLKMAYGLYSCNLHVVMCKTIYFQKCTGGLSKS